MNHSFFIFCSLTKPYGVNDKIIIATVNLHLWRAICKSCVFLFSLMGIIEVYKILVAENFFFFLIFFFSLNTLLQRLFLTPTELQTKTSLGAVIALSYRVTDSPLCEEPSEILRTSCFLNLDKGIGFHIFFRSVMC